MERCILNWGIVIIMAIISLPGVWAMSVQSSEIMFGKPDVKASKSNLFRIFFVQTLLLVALAAIAGAYFGPKVDLTDPFLEGLVRGEFDSSAWWTQIGWGIGCGILCSLVWIAAYYGYIRPRLDRQTVQISESLRNELGLWTRVTSGGIVEEVLFRWGLLSLTAWGLSLLIPSSSVVFWLSTLITGILFGLMHLPGNLQEGCKPSALLIVTALLGNLWVSVLCSYLFWQFGILAAFLVHILFHVIWHPLDRRRYEQDFSQPA